MKISRYDPVRRRRSPLSILLILAALVILAVLVAAWMRGGERSQQKVEIEIPADQLGR